MESRRLTTLGTAALLLAPYHSRTPVKHFSIGTGIATDSEMPISIIPSSNVCQGISSMRYENIC
jgi:hypothetical protein